MKQKFPGYLPDIKLLHWSCLMWFCTKKINKNTLYVKHYLNIEKWAYVHKNIFPKIRIKIYQKSGLIQISSAINLIQYLLRWFIGFYFVFMYRLTILQEWEVSHFTDSVSSDDSFIELQCCLAFTDQFGLKNEDMHKHTLFMMIYFL